MFFKANCAQGNTPIHFELDLDLFGEIDADASSGSFASVGRYNVVLKKQNAPIYWKTIVKLGSELPKNVKTWWDMKEKFSKELESYEKEEEDEL